MNWQEFKEMFPHESQVFQDAGDWLSTDDRPEDFDFTESKGVLKATSKKESFFYFPDRDDWDWE